MSFSLDGKLLLGAFAFCVFSSCLIILCCLCPSLLTLALCRSLPSVRGGLRVRFGRVRGPTAILLCAAGGTACAGRPTRWPSGLRGGLHARRAPRAVRRRRRHDTRLERRRRRRGKRGCVLAGPLRCAVRSALVAPPRARCVRLHPRRPCAVAAASAWRSNRSSAASEAAVVSERGAGALLDGFGARIRNREQHGNNAGITTQRSDRETQSMLTRA
jgi:hypothetical protein